MATDHNFIVKNGLEVGGQLIVNSSGQLVVANVTSNLDFADNIKARFGNGADLMLWHDGTDSHIQNTQNNGVLRIRSQETYFLNSDNNETQARFIENGAVTLFYDNAEKLATTSGGVQITGTLDVDVISNASGVVHLNDTLYFQDNSKAVFGDSSDLQIYHDGTNSVFNNTTGNLQIYNNADDKDIQFIADDGSGGTAEYFRLDGGNGYLITSKHNQHLDNVKSMYGGSNDLQIYHDGSDSYIVEQGQGSLIIRGGLNTYLQNTNGVTMAAFGIGGTAQLRYNGSTKLQTNNTGVDVTGELQSDSLDVDGNADISGNLVLGGNLTVSGTTTTVSSTNTTVTDALIELGSGNTGTNANDLGLIFERGTSGNNVFIGFDESDDQIAFALTTATGSSTGNLAFSSFLPIKAAGITGTSLDINGNADISGTLTMSNSSAGNMLNMNNNNIIGVNSIQIADPGVNEGVSWSNIKIYESPDDLTTNSAGNFQVVYGSTRRLTVSGSGIDANGTIKVSNSGTQRGELSIDSTDNFKVTATTGGGAGLLLWGAGGTVPTISPLKEGSGADGEVNLGRSSERFNDAHFSGTLYTGNGTNGAPSHTFSGDTDTGMYRGSSNSLQFSTGGVMRLNLDSSGNSNFTGAITSTSSITGRTGTFTGQNGTALVVNSGTTNVTSTFESGDATAWINIKDSASGTYGAMLGAEGGLFRLRTNNNDDTTDLTVDTSGNLGVSGAITSTTGNFSGLVSAERLEVTTANATINSSHPSMRRGSAGEMFLDAPGDIIMHIDSNNNNTDRRFRVRKDTAGSTDLFSVDESADTRTGGKLYLSGQTNNYLQHDGNYLKCVTSSGYIQIGPGNTSHAHLLTDRSNFYFNTELTVNTGVVGSYDEDLYLRRARTTSTGQLQLGRGTFSGNLASASDLDLSHTIIGGFTANSAFENAYRHFYVPGLSPNQLAGANKKFTVTATKNGSNFSLGGNMFSARGDFSSATVVAGTTDTIIITIVGIQLSYGQHYGIQFGNDSFRAKDIKIERSTDSGSTWSTIYDVDDFPLAVVNHYHGGNGTNTNAVRYTLTNFASTGLRINQLFAYDYSESGTYFSEKNRDENITANWTWKDMSKAQFGDNADMTLYHDGTNSIINNQQGTLYIDQNVDDGNLILRSDNGSGGLSEYIVIDGGTGSTILKSYGAEKAKTQSWGLLVTGTLNADSLHIGSGVTDLISVRNDSTSTQIATYRNELGGFIHRTYGDHGNDGTIVEAQTKVGADGNFSSTGNFSAHDFRLRTNNLDRMTVDGAGNIGIGLTNPSSLLHIYEDATSLNNTTTDLLKLEGNIVDFGTTPSAIALAFKFQDGNNSTNEARISMATVNDTDYGDNDEAASNLIFSTTNAGTEADKMIITGRGNIGIGTNNPAHNLTVSAPNNTTAVGFDIGSNAHFDFQANSTSNYTTTFYMDNTGLEIGHDSSSRNLALQTAGLDRLTIGGSGNTTLSGNLEVQGADVTITANIKHAGDTDTYFGFHGNNLWRVVTGGTERIEVRDSEIVINDGGSSYDFRVESNNKQNMLLVDGSTDRVGIGTSSPLHPLHVAGNIYSNGGDLRLDSSQKLIWGNSEQWIQVSDNDQMKFIVNNGEKVYFQTDGRIETRMKKHFRVNDVGNLTAPRYYKIATVNKGNSGITIKGTLANHVESFGTCKFDLAIFGREDNNGANISVNGTLDVASPNSGVRIVKQSGTGTYINYDVYIVVPTYAHVDVEATIHGSSNGTGNFIDWHGNNTYVTTAPTGAAIELNTSSLTAGHYKVTDSAISDAILDIPTAPSITSTSVVNETIELVFAQSATTGVDHYEVHSDGATGSDYSLIARIPPEDIAASMSVVDASFDDSGTVAYRVYAVKNGVYSSASTTTRSFSMPSLDVSSMSVIPDTNSFHIQYELPDTRFLDHVEIYKDAETTSGALARSGASLIYTGRNPSYKYNIGSSDMEKYHQFWVEVVTV